MTSSYCSAILRVVSIDRPSAGASTRRLPSTSAAGWASQVGYQKDRTSRFAWKREPAPPSKPSNEGACRNSVFINVLEEVAGSIAIVNRMNSRDINNVRKLFEYFQEYDSCQVAAFDVVL